MFACFPISQLRKIVVVSIIPLIFREEETKQRTPVVSLWHQTGQYHIWDKHPPDLSHATLAHNVDRRIRVGKHVLHQPS